MSKPTEIELAVAKAICIASGYEWLKEPQHQAYWLKRACPAIAAHTEALKSNGMVIVPRELVVELAMDLAAYINDHYRGDHPVTVRDRNFDLELVKEARQAIGEEEQ